MFVNVNCPHTMFGHGKYEDIVSRRLGLSIQDYCVVIVG